jgi:signal transduction histidine kinase
VLVNDITERKRAEEDLRASQAQLQQSQKLEAIGQLAGGVAHDFNNLLTAITGYSDLSLRRLDSEHPIRRNLEEIKKASDRAASLTRQLLACRKQILEPKVLDLNAVVKDMYKMLRRLIGEDIDLATNASLDLGKVKADPGQVEQIIMNLVVNARDAMPHGGKVTIETANVTLDERYASARRLMARSFKVDRSFVHNATNNPDDAALVTAIITLAHNLRLEVIAEGVETEEHLRLLRLLKCDEAQGFLFGRAMPAEIFHSLIAGPNPAEEGAG